MRVHTLITTLALSAFTLAAGCDVQTCTDAGCGTTLQLQIEGPDGRALPDSTYEIVVDLGGSLYSTVCSTSPGTTSCEPAEGAGPFHVDASITSTGTIMVEVNDDGWDALTPDTVALSVTAGDAPLFDDSWDVEYDIVHPNGEDCEPTCAVATENLVATIDVAN